jgi:RNA polymerase sigma-32 factor
MSVDGTFTKKSSHATSVPASATRRPAAIASKAGSSYLVDIRRFLMLGQEQEYSLAKRWREHRDRDAANQLVTSHLRLAAKVAKNYRGYGLPISDLVSEANLGLMQALDRFEPDKGFRFSTYAIWWIRASIQDYILRSWSLVKIGTTANQKKLFFKLRSAKNKISALENSELRPDQVSQIATTLGVKEREVIDMNRRLAGDTSLNAPLHEEGHIGERQDALVDATPSPEAILVAHDETVHRQDALARAIDVLNPRERRIFEARHLVEEPRTLEDLAVEFKVSRERVRQIEVRAFEKVRLATKRRFKGQGSPAAAWA